MDRHIEVDVERYLRNQVIFHVGKLFFNRLSANTLYDSVDHIVLVRDGTPVDETGMTLVMGDPCFRGFAKAFDKSDHNAAATTDFLANSFRRGDKLIITLAQTVPESFSLEWELRKRAALLSNLVNLDEDKKALERGELGEVDAAHVRAAIQHFTTTKIIMF